MDIKCNQPYIEQNSLSILNPLLQQEEFGFIMVRHVRSIVTNQYWIECYHSIRKYYDHTIIIIDDNSNSKYVQSNISVVNCHIIPSEFHGRGEILGYYYYYKYAFFKKAFILHDSTFIQKKIDFSSCGSVCFLWHFLHHWNDEKNEIEMLHQLHYTDILLNVYQDKKKWVGCFGVQSILTYDFLKKIVQKYNLFVLLESIQTREKRMNFERVFGLLCSIEKEQQNITHSMYGSIHHYIQWKYTYLKYIRDKKSNKLNHLDIIKVWSGR